MRHRKIVALKKETIAKNEAFLLSLSRKPSKPALKKSVNQILKESTEIEHKKFSSLDKFAGPTKKVEKLEPFRIQTSRRKNTKDKKSEGYFGLQLKYKQSYLKESDLKLPQKYQRDELNLGENSYSPENGLPMR